MLFPKYVSLWYSWQIEVSDGRSTSNEGVVVRISTMTALTGARDQAMRSTSST